MEGINDKVPYQIRFQEIRDLESTFPTKYVLDCIKEMIYRAYIAGAEGTKGIGLNFSKEERANDYLKLKGFIQ